MGGHVRVRVRVRVRVLVALGRHVRKQRPIHAGLSPRPPAARVPLRHHRRHAGPGS